MVLDFHALSIMFPYTQCMQPLNLSAAHNQLSMANDRERRSRVIVAADSVEDQWVAHAESTILIYWSSARYFVASSLSPTCFNN